MNLIEWKQRLAELFDAHHSAVSEDEDESVIVEAYNALVAHLRTDPVMASVPEDVARDAARYRWLRNRYPIDVLTKDGPDAGVWIDCEDADGKLILLTGDDADQAIDTAMLAAQGTSR